MKKVLLILGFLFFSLGAFAQEKSNVRQNELKGPAYKNYKPWMHETVPVKIYTDNNKQDLKGPAYKNYQVARDTSEKDLVLVTTNGDARQKLKGPAYKNFGPWTKKEQ
ncbi:hypothetical protein FFWV33_10245 [Flavobacterium faecale]|uniref:Uncharacterized protein n=1 Tax=Flavobacterium faecale TaxID=1355330 RepID=A0A2S1LIP0_9FLAO|nr:hypothetical protein [Flavobacterium faecale]AWG23623.1 hypothetical protein FFWV33_10245 [Flavobacterium faecale]